MHAHGVCDVILAALRRMIRFAGRPSVRVEHHFQPSRLYCGRIDGSLLFIYLTAGRVSNPKVGKRKNSDLTNVVSSNKLKQHAPLSVPLLSSVQKNTFLNSRTSNSCRLSHHQDRRSATSRHVRAPGEQQPIESGLSSRAPVASNTTHTRPRTQQWTLPPSHSSTPRASRRRLLASCSTPVLLSSTGASRR